MTLGRQNVGVPIGRFGQVTLFAWAIFLMGGFTMARRLEPDPRGFGTHQQFGLPECTVRLFFSRPCPGCGMTTCFAHFVRGNFIAAARANPAGMLLAMVCVLMIPWSLISATRGHLWLIENPVPVLTWTIVLTGGIAMLSWGLALLRGV